jgi:DnaJ like chaperone protein
MRGMWGKILGSMAGFAMGGPFGAIVGAALGHAAESGGAPKFQFFQGFGTPPPQAIPGQKEAVFSICVVVLSAKLAKCDGPVNRAEIDAFKRCFRVPPEAARDIGRLFDQARDSPEGYADYARRMGEAFATSAFLLEDVLASLVLIARADAPMNKREEELLQGVRIGFGLGAAAWARALGGGRHAVVEDDPYEVLGVARETSGEELRAVWKRLMRENHPDSLASRGVPPEFIARATDKVARINAAWDRIKRERGL